LKAVVHAARKPTALRTEAPLQFLIGLTISQNKDLRQASPKQHWIAGQIGDLSSQAFQLDVADIFAIDANDPTARRRAA